MEVDEEALGNIIDKGIYVDPTIAVGYRRMEPALQAEGPPAPGMQEWLDTRARRMEVFRTMWDGGVRFIVGTDSGMPQTPFGDWALTPELMVRELGLSPMQAIQAGTKVAAEALEMDSDIGTLAEGKLADIVIVRGDPLADVRALYEVDTVILAGRVVKRGGALLV